MQRIVGIDVGPEHSAYCVLNDGAIGEHCWMSNNLFRNWLYTASFVESCTAVESPQAQNRPLGPMLRDTMIWAGRFIESLESRSVRYREVDERDVRAWLCGTRAANNAALRQELLNRFGEARQVLCYGCNGGRVPGKRPGTTKACPKCGGEQYVKLPHALTGLNDHERSALAVAVYVHEKRSLATREPTGGA